VSSRVAQALKVTGGSARGRVVAARVPDGVRPTSSRVREALFSILGQDLHGVRVLDAFGGRGLLGFEAWSRGADVVIVEQDPRRAMLIRKSARALGCPGPVVTGDALRVAGGLGPFDGITVDPPYALDPAPILERLGPLAGAWLALESDARTPVPTSIAHLRTSGPRVYGDTALWVFEPELG
jgi:16S rRNA (guanine(966)-N(2))-methyltransferase RsmD